MPGFDPYEDFMSIRDAARYMDVTPQRIRELIAAHALRTAVVWGETWVVPAVVSGAVQC